MYCTKCGKEISENGQCDCTQTQQQQPQQQPQQQFQPQSTSTDNKQLFCILSYVSILWIIGMFVAPEKDDPRVRFHVGQGIILTIYSVALTIITSIITGILGLVLRSKISDAYNLFGVNFPALYAPSPIVAVISWLFGLAVWGSTVFLAVISILNITKNQDKPLPIIGSFAFYK